MSASPGASPPPSGSSGQEEEIITSLSGASVIEVNVPDSASDGGTTPPVVQPVEGRQPSDTMMEDSMKQFDHRVDDGSITLGSLQMESFEFSLPNNGDNDDSRADGVSEEVNERSGQLSQPIDSLEISASASQGGQSLSSEKSFGSVSDTDSSVLAQRVVSHVLTKAVTLAKEETTPDSDIKTAATAPAPEGKELDTIPAPEGKEVETTPALEDAVAHRDARVGLFQYSGLEEGREGDVSPDDQQDTPPVQDVKVGLFQYQESNLGDGGGDIGSPPVDKIAEPEIELVEDDDQENILKLYGLDSSMTGAGDAAGGDKTGEVTDQQREVTDDVQVEPATQFEESGVELKSYEAEDLDDSQAENRSVGRDSRGVSEQRFTEGGEDQVYHIEQTDHIKPTAENSGWRSDEEEPVVSGDDDTPQSDVDVTAPVVQYEPVRENGKFRIVKTTKDGYGASYSAIRVGGDVSSSAGSASSSKNTSPRDPEPVPAALGSREEQLVTASGLEETDEVETKEDIGVGEGFDAMSPRQHYIAMEPIQDGGSQGQTGSSAAVQLSDGWNNQEPVSLGETSSPTIAHAQQSPVEEDAPTWLPKDGETQRSGSSPRQQEPSREQPSKDGNLAELRSRYTITEGQRHEEGQHSFYRTSTDLETRQLAGGERPLSPELSRDIEGRSSSSVVPPQRDTERPVKPESPAQRYPVTQGGDNQSRYPTSYETDLINSAYSRVAQAQQTGRPLPQSYSSLRDPTLGQSASMDSAPTNPLTSFNSTVSSVEAGHIPGFKTLQEQQASWSAMFCSLEEQHKHELRAQYDRHQQNIHKLQDQMESELKKQHIAIRTKLDLHKEALASMSPERDRVSPNRGQRSFDRGQRSPDRDQYSPDRSLERRQQPVKEAGGRPEISLVEQEIPGDTKTWREIYQEVRAEEEKQAPTMQPPIKRSLDLDFAYSGDASPRSRSAKSTDWHALYNQRYEEEMNRSLRAKEPLNDIDRQSRSRLKQSPRQQVTPPPAEPVSTEQLDVSAGGMGNRSQDSVSPHVRELLDNLKEGRISLPALTCGLESPPREGEISRSARPRAGVYSSPMPILRGKGPKTSSKAAAGASWLDTSEVSGRSFSDDTGRAVPVDSGRPVSAPASSERRQTSAYRREHEGRPTRPDQQDGDLNSSRDNRNDDAFLSSSTRMNLREKHAKHMADLRAYYEDELRDLRSALSASLETSGVSTTDSVHIGLQKQLLETENGRLSQKCRALEDELDELYGKVRAMEQKCRGLEKRASEYSAAYSDAQAMGVQHKAHIEELQRYCHERDDLVNDLETKVRAQEDTMKIYKQNLEEEMENHRRDKNALQRIIDRYESMEREHTLLKETMNTTENKLYESRTEVVDLNRTISKLELENKRLGRENDNLRHKVTQSLNLSSVHESFGSPTSPGRQGERVTQGSLVPRDEPIRLPAEQSMDPSSGAAQSRSSVRQDERPIASGRTPVSSRIAGSAKKSKQQKDISNFEKPEQREETQSRPRSRQYERERSQGQQLRDRTPPRPLAGTSSLESEASASSPLLKAERELCRLRDMTREAVAIKTSTELYEPVLQKKFYGSERPTSKEGYTPDLGSARGKKEKPSSHSSVAKTKTSQHHTKSDKGDKPSRSPSKSDKGDKSSKRSASGSSKSDKHSHRKDSPARREGRKERDKPSIALQSDELNSSTRFDININEEQKSVTVNPQKVSQSAKQRNLFVPDGRDAVQDRPAAAERLDRDCNGDQVQTTLDRMRAGEYLTRPQWEDVHSSMAKPKEDNSKILNVVREVDIKDRMKAISDMEHRYDNLQAEKRQLESSVNKIPLHGFRHNRQHKEELEDRLDKVDKELGSLRMSLKRCHVLKTSS